jgi:hypothetical protein
MTPLLTRELTNPLNEPLKCAVTEALVSQFSAFVILKDRAHYLVGVFDHLNMKFLLLVKEPGEFRGWF